MRPRHQLMRNELHTRHASILLAALLMVALVPVTGLFSLEDTLSPAAASQPELAVSIPATRIAPTAIDWTGDWSGAWTEDAAQSASMVLVGTLLIGIGSIVRRSVL
jgi:hypothetical protein